VQAVSAFLILSRLVLHPASGEPARTARAAPPPLAVFRSRSARVRLSPPGRKPVVLLATRRREFRDVRALSRDQDLALRQASMGEAGWLVMVMRTS
jgi:hypothetical protein